MQESHMRLSVGIGFGLLLALCLAGCRNEPVSFGSLTFRLDVHPLEVSPDDSFTVHLVIRNVGTADTTLTSGCSVATFFALDGPAGIVYPAPGFGCLTVITRFKIPAGDSLTQTHRFVAHDIAQAGYPPLPEGTYVVFTDWQISGLPMLRKPINVTAIR
jgi:hypothetical protein